MKKAIKIFSAILGCSMALVLSVIWMFLFGNPVSYVLASLTAHKYVSEVYADTDYQIEGIKYGVTKNNFYGYWVQVASSSSIDSHFQLIINMGGGLVEDEYEEYVVGKRNTSERIWREYRALINTLFENPEMEHEENWVAYGDISLRHMGITSKDLELDKIYDVSELGRSCGEVYRQVREEDNDFITLERMAEILLQTKRVADEMNIGFYNITVSLSVLNGDYLRVENFLYSDIYEEGLIERIQENIEAQNREEN